MARYFPIFVSLEGKKIVVVGAGRIAGRRIRTLLEFGARLTVIAPEAGSEIQALAEQGKLFWRKESWNGTMEELLSDSFFVLAATDAPQVNEAVWKACKEREIPVNRADDRSRCDFYFPGIAEGGGVTVGVTAGGTDHRRAREVTDKLKKWLTEI